MLLRRTEYQPRAPEHGVLQLIATIDDPGVIRGILASLARPTEGADRAPPHFPPVPTGDPVTAAPA